MIGRLLFAPRRPVLAMLFGLFLSAEPAVSSPGNDGVGCSPVVYPSAGIREAGSGARGPGLVLSGAGAERMPVAALHWIRSRIGAARAGRGGNVVVLRASGEREYTDAFYRDGGFAWVQEIRVPKCAGGDALEAVAAYVERADAVFFAGGDQANYVGWKGSSLVRAVRALYARGGIVGGGSAGLAIQGAVVYDAVAANRLLPDDANVGSADAVRVPLERALSFTTDLFAWPPLRDTITDTHFAARDRFGRLAAFLARIVHDGIGPVPFYGLGIDEGSVVLVEAGGMSTLRTSGKSRGAYLLRLAQPVLLVPGRALKVRVDVKHVARDGERFDLGRKLGGGAWRAVRIDGERTPAYTNAYR